MPETCGFIQAEAGIRHGKVAATNHNIAANGSITFGSCGCLRIVAPAIDRAILYSHTHSQLVKLDRVAADAIHRATFNQHRLRRGIVSATANAVNHNSVTPGFVFDGGIRIPVSTADILPAVAV